MKLMIFLIAVLVLLWLLRRTLRRPPPPAPPKSTGSNGPQPMLACAQCGMHLPRDEALPGRGGVFCGEPHRLAYEKSHPDA
jgi:uncharacterized protein